MWQYLSLSDHICLLAPHFGPKAYGIIKSFPASRETSIAATEML